MPDIKEAVGKVVENVKSRIFSTLNSIDVSKKTKEKKDLTYLPWASAWAEVKKEFPEATFKVYKQIMDEFGNTRFWHDDGKTGWVEVGVTIEGLEHVESLPIMDFRNNSIPAEQITSVDANKSMQRCLVKACALHGLGLHIFEGEDVPESIALVAELKNSIKDLIDKKVKLSDKAKEQVAALCRAAEKEANPELGEDLISGNYKNIEDADILTQLKKQLLAVRK